MADKELSPELRILLAFVISFLILYLARPLLVKTPPPAPPKTQAPVAPQASKPQTEAIPSSPALPSTENKQGSSEELITVESSLYRIVLSTRGAVVKSWMLQRYRDELNNPLDLVNAPAAAQFGYPLSVWVSDETSRRDVNDGLYVPSATGTLKAPVTLTFDYSAGGIAVRKRIAFSPDSYVADVTTDLTRDGKPLPHALAWRGGFGDLRDLALRGGHMDVFYREQDKISRLNPKDVKGEESVVSGPFAFAGIEDRFFAVAFLPPESILAQGAPQPTMRLEAFQHQITVPGIKGNVAVIGTAVGEADSPENRLRLFVGPKDTDILASVDRRMPELIDYGWFTIVAKPLFAAMRWIHERIVPNWGWSIVILTIFINLVLFPLKVKGLRSAMKMQKIAPQVKAIQEKYKQYKATDPRKADMTKETMELYKKHGVNPIGGCLPMILQLPFLYGFYRVLLNSIELRHAPWILWVRDLSAPEPLPIKILPLLMCGTQFVLQRMTPTPAPDPRQQKMMMFMPVMFLFIFWNLSSGLVLYWFTSNITGIVQQWYINRVEVGHAVEERKQQKARKKQPVGKS